MSDKELDAKMIELALKKLAVESWQRMLREVEI